MTQPAWTQSLRALGHEALQLLQLRLELLGLEAQDASVRAAQLIFFAGMAVFLLGLALIFIAVLVTVLCWEQHRILALSVCSGFFLASSFLAAYLAYRRWSGDGPWFAGTREELQADIDHLQP